MPAVIEEEASINGGPSIQQQFGQEGLGPHELYKQDNNVYMEHSNPPD